MDVYLYSSRSSPSRAFLLRVRVSNFVLFCSLGFLACSLVGLNLLHLAHTVGIVVLLLVLLVLLGEYPFYNLPNFVVCLDCFLRCNFRRCLDCVLTSVLVRLVLVSVLCCLLDLSIILDWGKRLSRS